MGLHAVQFRNNGMKKAPITAEIGRDSRPITLREICLIKLFPKWWFPNFGGI